MKISRKSALSHEVHEREIPIDAQKYAQWQAGALIGFVQDVFPHLSADDREFLLTGITPQEWQEAFGDEEDDDDVSDLVAHDTAVNPFTVDCE
jgi:hypothetical protein